MMMSKGNSNGPTVHVRTARPKTAKQKAAAEANMVAAQKRLAELQHAQKLGFKSVGDHKAHLANTAASEWLAKVFNVRGHGMLIKRWLANRIEQAPTVVQGLVVDFLSRERNVDIAAVVADEAFGGFKEELKRAA